MASYNSVEEEIRLANERYAAQKNQKIADINSSYAKESETVKTLYDGKIGDTQQDYDDLSRQNEVQRYINAREVAENNANLGLTDSGLNRTQQTAVQLSASNNEAKIQRARQSAVDTLTREMTSMLASVESSRAGAEREINDYYEQLASQEGRAIYDTNVQAETARIQAEIEAETKRIQEETKRIEAEQKKTSAKNSAYTTLVKDLYNSRNADNLYDKNTVAAMIKAYVDEYGFNESEVSAIWNIGGITKDEYARFLEYGNVIDQQHIKDNPFPFNPVVNRAIRQNSGLYY